MIRWISGLLGIFLCLPGFCQTENLADLPKKGSYLYYGQPAFEDNSFLLDEAINQEKGIMQYISNFYFDNVKGGNFIFSFSQEIPLSHLKHQVNYTLLYHVRSATSTSEANSGFGDLSLSYSYMATGKKDWAMIVPAISVLLPTGKSSNGIGNGGLGGQINLAITKRISHKVITHYNFGFAYISQADRYTSNITGVPVLSYEKDLQFFNLAASVVWYPHRKINLFGEYVANFLSEIKDDGTIIQTQLMTMNPGFRFAIDGPRFQIVPGVSIPTVFNGGEVSRVGIFFYLSLEGEYLPFIKSKHR